MKNERKRTNKMLVKMMKKVEKEITRLEKCGDAEGSKFLNKVFAELFRCVLLINANKICSDKQLYEDVYGKLMELDAYAKSIIEKERIEA